jgi:hypothetical protein
MTMSPEERRTRVDPFEETNQAGIVAAWPQAFDRDQLNRLFSRTYRYLKDVEDHETDDLIEAAEEFALKAFKPNQTYNEPGEPLVENPSMLAVIAVLAASAVTQHDELKETPPRQLKLFQDIADLYATTLIHQFDADDRLLDQDLAEFVYQKDRLHAGRTCTGIVDDVDGLPKGTYIEIPLVAASQQCMVRETDGTLGGGFDPDAKVATGELTSHIANNNVYVPAADLYRRVRRNLEEDGFRQLYEAHTALVSASNLRRFLGHESAISERIDRFLRGGQRELVWKDWNPNARVLRVVRSAVASAESLDRGNPYPAKTLIEAVERYRPNQDWEERVLSDLTSQRSLASRLVSVDDAELEIIETRAGKPNLYRVGHAGNRARPIEFEQPTDLFELPCLSHLDERLSEASPTRKDLYNIVRMLRWLPGYRPDEMGRDAFVQEMKNLLSKYPWYDEATSDYQIRYELDRRNESGDPYLPMGCSNPDMERYCIGREACPYSIYGSLPFPDEMYAQIDPE